MLWVRIPFRRSVLDTALCAKVCQWLATDLWFSPDTSVSSINKTDATIYNITELVPQILFFILLKQMLTRVLLHLRQQDAECRQQELSLYQLLLPLSTARSKDHWGKMIQLLKTMHVCILYNIILYVSIFPICLC
jgi:hypothetical protein